MRITLLPKKTKSPEKRGLYQLCPQCGERVNSTMVKCPSCGWVFDEVEASNSIRELSMQLSSMKDKLGEDEIIDNFPIPKTKSDLLELIVYPIFRMVIHKINKYSYI